MQRVELPTVSKCKPHSCRRPPRLKQCHRIHLYVYDECDAWYFRDRVETPQGPFHADEMRAWMDARDALTRPCTRMGHSPLPPPNMYNDLSLTYPAEQLCRPCVGVQGPPTREPTIQATSEQKSTDAGKGGESKLTLVTSHRSLKDRISIAHSSPRSSGNSELKTGFLDKRGRLVTGWRRRFFVLTANELRYYAREGGKPRGSLPMQNVEVRRIEAPGKGMEPEYHLQLQTQGRTCCSGIIEGAVLWCIALEQAQSQKAGASHHVHSGTTSGRRQRALRSSARLCQTGCGLYEVGAVNLMPCPLDQSCACAQSDNICRQHVSERFHITCSV